LLLANTTTLAITKECGMKWTVKRQYVYAYVVLVCLPTPAGASDERYAPHIASMEQLASSYEREVSIERLAGEFSEFAGSRPFAEAIMSGLHEGKPIRFVSRWI